MCSRSSRGEPEVARDRLEAVAGQVARREVVAEHGVERVDQLAAGDGVADAAQRRCPARGRRAAAGRWRRPGPTGATERERDAEHARAALEERQIEAVQVVVLDHVRIAGARRARPGARSAPPRRADRRRAASRISVAPSGSRTAMRKIRSRAGSRPVVSRSSWSAAQVVEREVAKVGAPGGDQVLLLGRQHRGPRRRTARGGVRSAGRGGGPRRGSTAVTSVAQSSARTR